MIRPDSLEAIGRVLLGRAMESVRVTPDGRRLLVAAAGEPHGCCGLYAIDLAERTATLLAWPGNAGTPSPRGDLVFAQRGAVGIEVFDLATGARVSWIEAPGNYQLSPSADGRWIFGVTDWEGPSLDLIDVEARRLVRRLPIPYEGPSGTWRGDRFDLYAFDGRQGHLWTVKASSIELGSARTIAIPPLPARNLPPVHPFQRLISAGSRLLVYQAFGGKDDDRPPAGDGRAVPGGVFEIDPQRPAVRFLARDLHFARLVAAPDGASLFGIDVESGAWSRPRLLKLDGKTGRVLARRDLAPAAWDIQWADIPSRQVVRGDVRLESR
jgi:hypothetical protein